MNLKDLINLLPSYFKDQDTYKVNGKGVLERFLEICGTYFQDTLVEDIDHTLDLIDLDSTPEYCLNYFWELLGELPFAYGASIDKDKFEKHYNGLLSKEDIESLKNNWTQPKAGPVILSDAEVRNLLKYAISLIKIRGSRQFFEIMFRLYGFDIEITDPTDTYTKSTGECTSNYTKEVLSLSHFDGSNFDTDKGVFDVRSGCNPCIPINVNISTEAGFMDKYAEYFRDSLSVIFSGKYDGLAGLTTLTLNELLSNWAEVRQTQDSEAEEGEKVIRYYSTDQDDWVSDNTAMILSGTVPASVKDFTLFRNMVENFFDRYLPYNVRATFTYNGATVDDGVVLYVDYVDSDNTTLDLQKHPEGVPVRVTIRSNWPKTEKKYQVCSEYIPSSQEDPEYFTFKGWGVVHDTSEIFYITKPGVYYFKHISGNVQTVEEVDGTTATDSRYKMIVVTKHEESISYTVEILNNSAAPLAPEEGPEAPNNPLNAPRRVLDSPIPDNFFVIPTVKLDVGYLTPNNWATVTGYHQYRIGSVEVSMLCTKTVVTKDIFVSMDGTIGSRNESTTTSYVPLKCDTSNSCIFQSGPTVITLPGAFPVYNKLSTVVHRVYVEEFPSLYKDLVINTSKLTLNLSVSPASSKLINNLASTTIAISSNYDAAFIQDVYSFPKFKALCTTNNGIYSDGDIFETRYIGSYRFVPINEYGSDFSTFTPVVFNVENFINSQYGLVVNPQVVKLGSSISIRVYTIVQGDDTLDYNVNIYEANHLMTTLQAKTTIQYTPTTRGVLKVECVGDPNVYAEVTVLPPSSEDTKTGLYIEEADGSEQYGVTWLQRGNIDALDINRCIVSRCMIVESRNNNNSLHNFKHTLFRELGFNPVNVTESVPFGYNIYDWEDSEGNGNIQTYNSRSEVFSGNEPTFRYAHSESPSNNTWDELISAGTTVYGNLDVLDHLSTEFGYYSILSLVGTERSILHQEPYYLVVGPAFNLRSFNNSKVFIDNGKVVTVYKWYKNTNSEWVKVAVQGVYKSVTGTTIDKQFKITTNYTDSDLCCIDEHRIFGSIDGPYNQVCMYEFQVVMDNQETYRALLFIYNKDYVGSFNERFDIQNETIIEQ